MRSISLFKVSTSLKLRPVSCMNPLIGNAGESWTFMLRTMAPMNASSFMMSSGQTPANCASVALPCTIPARSGAEISALPFLMTREYDSEDIPDLARMVSEMLFNLYSLSPERMIEDGSGMSITVRSARVCAVMNGAPMAATTSNAIIFLIIRQIYEKESEKYLSL